MVHAEDSGLALPPKVAPVQVVVVPRTPKKLEDNKKVALENSIENLATQMKKKVCVSKLIIVIACVQVKTL